MAKKKKRYNKHDYNYDNRNNKVKLKTIAEKVDVDIEQVLSCAVNLGYRIYNLPPKGAKKPRYFVSSLDANKIKNILQK